MNTKNTTEFLRSNIGRAVGAMLPVLLAVGVAALGLLAAAAPAQAQLDRAPYLQALSGTSATISWRTSTPEDSRVQYGSAPGLLTSESTRAASVKTHDVSLTDLVPGTRYYYSVGSSSTVHDRVQVVTRCRAIYILRARSTSVHPPVRRRRKSHRHR